MSVRTVARDDLLNVGRSAIVLGVVGLFTALVGLVFVAEIDVYDEAYRTIFDASALVAFAFPLFVAPLTYLSIAGERADGTVKFSLGLPNSRAGYFLGKLLSRGTVAVATIAVGVAVAFVIARAAFTTGATAWRFAAFAAVAVLYTASLVGLFVAISASVSGRSRAMFAILGTYFVLVPFWFGFLPVVNLGTVIDAVTGALGVTLSRSGRDLIAMLSPATAFLQSTEIVYGGVMDQYDVFAGNFRPESDALARTDWFPPLVLCCWAVLAPAVGYLRFRRAELG